MEAAALGQGLRVEVDGSGAEKEAKQKISLLMLKCLCDDFGLLPLNNESLSNSPLSCRSYWWKPRDFRGSVK